MKNISKFLLFLFLINTFWAQQNQIALDTVKAYRFDTGKMWTFDFPPAQYFKEAYNFEPSQEWFDEVRMSTLRIPGCSASFISEDGLMITNYHCSDFHIEKYQLENEDILRDGFFAATMEEERKVPEFVAERLEFITDVTEEIHGAIAEGMTEDEKVKNKEKKEEELIAKYNEETGLACELVTLYNGGKYSIYGYHRFEDVRLVFIPEWRVGQFGGDEDNFTYPRYSLDFTLYRVYDENGEPLKVDNYYRWNSNGPKSDDFLFSIGNPGSTSRLLTIAELEYLRDILYRNYAYFYDTYYNRLEEAKAAYPAYADDFEKERMDYGNSQKALTGFVNGLNDPYFMARKQDFENKFKTKVAADKDLNSEYGHLWKAIEIAVAERKKHGAKLAAYTMSRRRHSVYFDIAKSVIDYAEGLKKEENKDNSPDVEALVNQYFGKEFNSTLELVKLGVHADYLLLNVGDSDVNVNNLLNGKKGIAAAEYLTSESKLTSAEKLKDLLSHSADEILNSGDPFITFLQNTKDELAEMKERDGEITESIAIYQDQLGRALFEVYGTTIPPDANFTLRITDGTIINYKYNGTTAPVFTTFYGMYDRYYSYEFKYPWLLPNNWLENEKSLNLSTHYNFLSTFDLVGGSSGSPVINKDKEFVGIAFDGNIESLTGDFIFQPEINRSISVSSGAIIEALKVVYKAERVVDEMTNGKIVK